MWWRKLTQRERERIEERIETVGKWLMNQGAAQSVGEDLLAHQLRSLLADLRDAARQGRRRESRRLLAAIEGKVMEFWGRLLLRR